MRLYIRLLVLLLIPAFAMAKSDGGQMNMGRWSIGGYYGFASVNPSDINTSAGGQATTPKLGNITGDTLYGGQLGLMLTHHLQARVSYEVQDAKNPTTLTSPAVSNAGYELFQNDVWGSLNYFVINGEICVWIGGSVGYPTYSHATLTTSTKTEYDADKTLGFMGQSGVALMLGMHFAIFIEAGYQQLASGNLKDPSGNILKVNGNNAVMDLSGARGKAGLTVIF